MTDIDTALVAQPRELHLIADQPVVDLLPSADLQEIPGAGTSLEGTFHANPALDLRITAERQEQVDDWLRQLGLDAGLSGMEALVERYRATTTPPVWSSVDMSVAPNRVLSRFGALALWTDVIARRRGAPRR
ncbi:hypothetical protein AB0469_39935 [Streptomyces sp. NPDC093801]|uniref:hypothetical protein n=1 Tax=Streptomyces sp. NPDC093801 TaxID=3155203 RepID=UPI00344D9777